MAQRSSPAPRPGRFAQAGAAERSPSPPRPSDPPRPALRLLSRGGDEGESQFLEGLGAMREETRMQLRTLLTLCRLAGSASAAGLYLRTDEGWAALAHSAAPAALPRLTALAPSALDGAGRDDGAAGLDLLSLESPPLLVLALLAERPLSEEERGLMRQALALARPLVVASLEARRRRRTRRALLDLQAELAHELRTPLTAVSGFAQLLQRPGALDERRRVSYAGIAVAEAQQATAMVDTLVAKLQAEAEALDAPLGPGEPEGAARPAPGE